MGDNTKIEWTDTTWSPVRGCSLISAGCENCYAMKQAHRFAGPGQPYEGLTEIGPRGPRWTGKVRLVPDLLDAPLRWRKPCRIFVNSMSDLFHDDVPDTFIGQVFVTMALASQHTFQVLTKRPQRMVSLLSNPPRSFPISMLSGEALPNVWLGVSVEDQATADARIPILLQTPAAVRWVSAEPLLGPMDLAPYLERMTWDDMIAHQQETDHEDCESVALDWVVVGGESGTAARPMDMAWARSLRDQCVVAQVPIFYKQGGTSHRCQHSSKGGCLACAPADLRVREFPA